MVDSDTERIDALETDPSARVMVFIDGQNLYKTCEELFDHPVCHPHLLAEYLAGPRTKKRIACRFYSGRPSQNIPAERRKLRNFDRRMNVYRSNGVTVETRPLRYHWDWGHQEELPEPELTATPITVTLRPWQRPQEKGIDQCIALDVVEFALTDLFDVGIVVSLDRDLFEIPRAVRNLRRYLPHPVRLEAAVPVADAIHYPKTLKGFSHTHQIDPVVFSLIRDDTDYKAQEAAWTPPSPPKTLAEARELAQAVAANCGQETATANGASVADPPASIG
jgi:uncharacterized LabA/DUF88 family protein